MRQTILDYKNFEVYLEDGEFWFRDKDEEGQPVKVKVVASLEFDLGFEPDEDALLSLFGGMCMCSGEELMIENNVVRYLWFDIVEEDE